MRKPLLIIGAVGLLLVILIVGALCYGAFMGSRLDASSKLFVDTNVPAIIASWSKNEIVKHASEELKEDLAGQQWDMLTAKVSKLGSFQHYVGSEGHSYISFSPKYGKVITALYTARANFQNGEAAIKMEMVWRNSQWQIATFKVDSPQFSE